MLTEKRIQVYLPEKDYKSIKQRAQADGKSIAQVLREAATQYLLHDAHTSARPKEAPPPAERIAAARDHKGDTVITPQPSALRMDEPDDEWQRWQGITVR